jgi:hypothetical protein
MSTFSISLQEFLKNIEIRKSIDVDVRDRSHLKIAQSSQQSLIAT